MKETLRSKDPKFFQFLLENDRELLEEISDNESVHSSGESVRSSAESVHSLNSDTEEEDEREQEQEENGDTAEAKLPSLTLRLQDNSLSALKVLLSKFKSVDECSNEWLIAALQYSPAVFGHHLGSDPSNSSKFPRLKTLLKSFLSSTLKLIDSLSDASLLKVIIQSAQEACIYYTLFPKLGKQFLKALVSRWSLAQDEQVRIVSFLCIRKLATASPKVYLDMTIKHCRRALIHCAKQSNPHTWTQLSFMAHCITELCGLDLALTYQHVFVYLRELAVQLRGAIAAKTKDAFRQVYNWEFLHSIKLWGLVLCTYCDAEQHGAQANILRPLVYPFVQISTGVMKLKPSSRFYPFRLTIIQELSKVGQVTNTFIPLASYLLEMFDSPELQNKPKPSTLKPFDMELCIKAPNAYLGTVTYHKSLVEAIVNCLFDYFSSWAGSIAFPELVVPTIIQVHYSTQLKRMIKHSKDVAANKQIQQLIEQLETNSKFVESKRNQESFAPSDVDQASMFMKGIETPLVKYNNSRRAIRKRQPKNTVIVDESDDEETLIEKSEMHQDQSKKEKKHKKEKKEMSQSEKPNSDKKKHGKKNQKKNSMDIDEPDQLQDLVLSDDDSL